MKYIKQQLINTIGIAILLIQIFACSQCLGQNHNTNKILVINSFDQEYAWTNNILKCFSREIKKELGVCQIYTENLNVWNFNYEEIKDSVRNIIETKYKRLQPDLIIITDDYAFNFMAENHDTVFKDIPVVFCGVNYYPPENINISDNLKNNLTGIVEYTDYSKLLNMIQHVNPDTTKIQLLVDNTVCGENIKYGFLAQSQNLVTYNYEVEIIDGSNVTTGEMLNLIQSSTGNTTIIAPVWSKGSDNVYINPYETFKKIISNTKTPVFTIDSAIMGHGAIGGLVNSEELIGKKISEIAVNIINGKRASDIPIIYKGATRSVFDLDEILKYGIPVSSIPSGSDIIESGGKVFTDISTLDNNLSPWELQWINENPNVTIALVNRPPIIESINRIDGFAVDYINILAQEIGLKLNFKYRYSSTLDQYEQLKAGEDIDLIIATAETPERLDLLNFTEPWLTLQYALFVKSEEDLLFYNSLDSLKGKTIAVEVGSKIHYLLKREYKDIAILPVEYAECGIKAVDSGKAFAWLGDHTVGIYLIRKLNIDNVKIGTSVYELGKHKLAIAVNKDEPILFEIIKKAINRVPASKINELRQKYSGEIIHNTGLSLNQVIEYGFMILLSFTIILTAILYKHKKARDDIRKKEEDLRATFDSIGDGIIVIDCDKIIVRINRKAEEILDYSNKEATGKELSIVYDVIDSQATKIVNNTNSIETDIANNFSIEYASLISKGGKQYKIIDNAAPIMDRNNQNNGTVIIFRDVSHQYEIEQQMQQAEQQRQIILDNITVGVCFYDNNLYPARYNKQMLNYCGNGPESSLTGGFFSTLTEDNEEKFSLDKPVTFTVCKGSSDDGQEGYEYEVTGLPIIDNDNTVGILEIVVDVSEHRKLQNELESASAELTKRSVNLEEQVETRTEELSSSNLQLNKALNELKAAQGKMILSEKMSALGQLISGIAQEINTPLGTISEGSNIIEKNITGIIENIDTLEQHFVDSEGQMFIDMLLKGIKNISDDTQLTTRKARSYKHACKENLKKLSIENADDLARVLVEMRLDKQYKQYSNLLQSQFIQDNMQTIIQILNIYGCCSTITTGVNKASTIVLALKNYVSQSNEKNSINNILHHVNIRQGLETVLTLFNNRIRKYIKIEMNIDEDLPEVQGNSDELNQVWTNLIENAIDAMPDGGILSFIIKEKNDGILAQVKDTGTGMTPEIKNKIFEPMFTTKPEGTGTGLGMEIARRIIEDHHNGNIEVESEPDNGTIISFWLPGANNNSENNNIPVNSDLPD